MDLIALAGPQLAGKTTLARALVNEGYLLIDFTSLLKRIAVASLAGAGHMTTVEEINERKLLYRPYLQGLGTVIGFNIDSRYVLAALAEAMWHAERKAVFDNVRTVEQYCALAELGFELVYLDTSEDIRYRRAESRDSNLTLDAFMQQHAHPVEDSAALFRLAAVVLKPGPVEQLVYALTQEFVYARVGG